MVLQHSGQTLIHELLLLSLYAFSIRISRLAASASHVYMCPQWRIWFLGRCRLESCFYSWAGVTLCRRFVSEGWNSRSREWQAKMLPNSENFSVRFSDCLTVVVRADRKASVAFPISQSILHEVQMSSRKSRNVARGSAHAVSCRTAVTWWFAFNWNAPTHFHVTHVIIFKFQGNKYFVTVLK